MEISRRVQVLALGLMVVVAAGPVAAAEPTTSTTPTTSQPTTGTTTPAAEAPSGTDTTATPAETPAVENALAPSEPITELNFNLPAPSSWQFFKRRVVRLFTFNDVKQLELDVELANLTLLAADRHKGEGDTERAVQLVERFDETMTDLSAQAADLAVATGQSDTVAAQAILEGIQADRCLQAGLVEQLAANAPAELAATALQARTTALRDLTKLLTVDQPDPATFAERVAKVSGRLYEREGQLATQFVGKLALLEEIDSHIDRINLTGFQDLRLVIAEVETKHLDTVKEANPALVGQIARVIEGSLGKPALILGALLDRVPAAARQTIETTLDASLKRLEQQAAQDPTLLTRYFGDERPAGFQEKILERMADHGLTDPAVHQAIETELAASKDRAKEWERLAGDYEKKYGVAPSDVVPHSPVGSPGSLSAPTESTGSSGTSSGSGSGSSTAPAGGAGNSSRSGSGSGSGSTYTAPATSPTDAPMSSGSSLPPSSSGTTSGTTPGSGTTTPPPTDSSGSSGTTPGSGSTTTPAPTSGTGSGSSGSGSTTTPPSSTGTGSGSGTYTPPPSTTPGSGSGTYTPPPTSGYTY